MSIRVDGETVVGVAREQAQGLDLAQVDIRHDGLAGGGKVIVRGSALPPGVTAQVQGKAVPVSDGAFEADQELATGDHVVRVRLHETATGRSLEFERDVHVAATEWFYVGLADVTVGKLIDPDKKLISQAAAGEFEPVYAKGRLAFYLKGKIKGSTIITAALDTRNGDLDTIFTNLDGSDPGSLLRRLDPDDYYPVYGDDSTTLEDAPTNGKFYLRIENGGNRITWGNFKTRIDGVELARYKRGLYGGSVELASERETRYGGPAARLSAFAAQPGTLPSRDELRGTGGSVYFLQRQDITTGSAQVVVEERDAITGVTLSRRLLNAGTDYEIDYVQGMMLLKRPLASTVRSSSAVQGSSLGGNQNFLVVTYEYAPLSFEGESYSLGGRAESWLTDHLRAGVTAFQENAGTSDQTLIGTDLVLQLTQRSWFEFEWAQAEGQSFGKASSGDGGLIFNPSSSGDGGGAFRVKGVVDFKDIPGAPIPGNAGFHFTQRADGFSAPGNYNANNQRIAGAFLTVGSPDKTVTSLRYDAVEQSGGRERQEGVAEFDTRINESWSAGAGLRYSLLEGNAHGQDGNGGRLDAGVRLTRHFGDDSAWVFAQGTAARSGSRNRNDRVGVGADFAFTEEFSAEGEVSWGTSGLGLLAGLSYQPNADDRYHIGYRLAPHDSGIGAGDAFADDRGAFVAGANRKLSDQLSVYTEHSHDFLGGEQSVMRVAGLDYVPDDAWRFGFTTEAGEIQNDDSGDFNRIAISGAASRKIEGHSAGARLEARFEEALEDGGEDRNTFLATANWSLSVNPDWRFLAKADAVISRSDEGVILDGDYVEASAGFAYRPVENDNLNALVRYTYLQDLPGPSQVNALNQKAGPRQRSHVVSADLVRRLNEKLSVGAKYGIRIGEVEWTRGEGNFETSTAQLAVVRLDYEVVHKWDVLLEARALWMSELEQVQYGALAGIYRQVSDNLKVGVGYNFGRYSDNLTDLSHDDGGMFLNVIGQF